MFTAKKKKKLSIKSVHSLTALMWCILTSSKRKKSSHIWKLKGNLQSCSLMKGIQFLVAQWEIDLHMSIYQSDFFNAAAPPLAFLWISPLHLLTSVRLWKLLLKLKTPNTFLGFCFEQSSYCLELGIESETPVRGDNQFTQPLDLIQESLLVCLCCHPIFLCFPATVHVPLRLCVLRGWTVKHC